MKLKLALLAAAGSLALIPAANAGDGWYGALGAGYTFDNDSVDFEGPATPADFVSDYDLDGGINLYGALGKHLKDNWRAEFELARREQEVDEIPGDGLGFAGFASDGNIGEVTVTTLMLNVYRDFDLGDGRLNPYVGVGLGGAKFRPEVDNIGLTAGAAANAQQPYRAFVSENDVQLAWQAMAGLAFDLSDDLDFDLRYRYLDGDTFRYGAFINNEATTVESQYRASEITAGLRWNFGAGAPAPAPAPAPAVSYKDCWDGSRVVTTAECPPEIVETVDAPEDIELTVYFDYDKSNLTSAASSLISAKSEEALQYDISSVNVAGNTDTSGSASYNNALSARRAAVVRDALVSNGVAGGLISVQALGESNLAKPTADGVREPLNRRTDVKFNF